MLKPVIIRLPAVYLPIPWIVRFLRLTASESYFVHTCTYLPKQSTLENILHHHPSLSVYRGSYPESRRLWSWCFFLESLPTALPGSYQLLSMAVIQHHMLVSHTAPSLLAHIPHFTFDTHAIMYQCHATQTYWLIGWLIIVTEAWNFYLPEIYSWMSIFGVTMLLCKYYCLLFCNIFTVLNYRTVDDDTVNNWL